jgi:hypothetical protein
MRKGRKRKLILETNKYEQPIKGSYNNIIEFQSLSFEPLIKNRFLVQLENDNEDTFIDSSKIKSIQIKSNKNNSFIVLEPFLHIHEWVENYKKMNICKIFFLDPTGLVIKSFDYDISYFGYEYELNYSDSDIFAPKIFYNFYE